MVPQVFMSNRRHCWRILFFVALSFDKCVLLSLAVLPLTRFCPLAGGGLAVGAVFSLIFFKRELSASVCLSGVTLFSLFEMVLKSSLLFTEVEIFFVFVCLLVN